MRASSSCNSDSAKGAHGATKSKIVPTKTEAAMKLFVVEKENGPVKGVVICLSSPTSAQVLHGGDGRRGLWRGARARGAEVRGHLPEPRPQGHRDAVTVTGEPRQNIKLTLRFKCRLAAAVRAERRHLRYRDREHSARVADRLDVVAEFMRRKSAVIEISGHTDNVGKAKANKALSLKRAKACRAYLMSKGIDGSRITAVGYGGERPAVPNDTAENREKNRRIEVIELEPPSAGVKGAKSEVGLLAASLSLVA